MEIVLKADKNVCEISGWQSNTGEVNARTLNVEMCEEMCSCAMAFVTFKLQDGTVYESLVTDGKANIPTIDEDQFIEVGVYSADIENDKCVKRFSPHPTSVYVNAGSYSGKSTEPPVITPTDYEKLVDLIKNSSGDVTEITKETYISELESGIYRCKSENGFALYFDRTWVYGLTDGIAIISHVEGGAYQWFAIGLDPAYLECAMIGVSVVNDDGVLVVENAKSLTSVLVADDVLQTINDSTSNPPRAVYSVNVINKSIVLPTTEHIIALYGKIDSLSKSLNDLRSLVSLKEDVSNKVTEIDPSDTSDTEYATTEAVYNFGVLILKEVEKMLENINVNTAQLTAEAISTFTMNTSAEVNTDA